MIMIRSIFRIAEYVMGQDGYLLGHEYFLYIFDGALMWLTMVLFNICHPSSIIENGTRKNREHSRDPESMDSGFELTHEDLRMRQKP